MSFGRRYFNPGSGDSKGPSDEMLAVDAVSEIRSLTLLYDRYADRLYRYFLICTGDPRRSERMLRGLLTHLPEDLQRYTGEERSFGGWLFSRASALVWRDHSIPSRLNSWIMRLVPGLTTSRSGQGEPSGYHETDGIDEDAIFRGLSQIGPSDREVLGLVIGANLTTLSASEAMRLPASLLKSHVETALRALAGELDASSVERVRNELQALVEQQHLSRDQRSSHLALIHGLFHGEIHPEPDEDKRGPALEIVTLIAVVIIGLGGIWVWGQLTPGDTGQHDVQIAAVPEDDEPSATSTPEPSATPRSGSLGEGGAVDGEAETCIAADGKSVFDQFVRRFNDGDFESVQSMLPSPSYEHPLLDGDAESEPEPREIFNHHDVSLGEPRDIIEYLRMRHEAGERWEVLQAYPAEHYRHWQNAAPLEMYRDWKRENPELSIVIVAGLRWLSPEGQEEIATGRVIVDCGNQLVIDWDLRTDESQTADLVGIADFMFAMEPLAPRESREVRARVETGARSDGGELSIWEVIWSEAAGADGDLRERVDIRTLDGMNVITQISDSQRWRLDWRGWVAYGDAEDPVVPEEISLSVPWLKALPDMLAEHPDAANADEPITLSEDYSFTADNLTERWFEIDVEAGAVRAARLREVTTDGERNRPELTLLGVGRSSGYDAERYEVGMEPRFPENDVHAPRYRVPDDDWSELSTISLSVGDNPFREEYRLSWNGVELTLAVWPSRGGLDLSSIPESVDDSWAIAVTDYRYGPLAWAYRQFSGYPTDALWDDGRYRFELVVDRDAIEPEDDWNLEELVRLANALSGSTDGASSVGNRHRGRSMNYPVPSMFNH